MVIQSWRSLQLLPLCMLVCLFPAFAQWRKHIFVKEPRDRTEAHRYCLTHHAALSSILSQADQDDLQAQEPNKTAWIGLHRRSQNWKWTDGTKPAYYNWKVQNKCAVVTWGGFWVSKPCGDQLPFICQSAQGGNVTVSDGERNWEDAKKWCEKRGWNLVTFRNAEAKLEEPPKGSHWMGLWRRGKQDWRWVGGGGSDGYGDAVTYTNWRTRKFCAVIRHDGKWEDRLCQEEHGFVCRRGGHYELVQSALTWEKAQEACLDRTMALASIHNASDNLNLQQRVTQSSSQNLWIGLSDRDWFWAQYPDWYRAQGPRAEHFLWAPGEPNAVAYRERCAVTKKGKWNDIDCSKQHPFFCLMRPKWELQLNNTAPSSWENALAHCRQQKSWDLASLGRHDNNDNIDIGEVLKVVATAKTEHVWVGLRFLMEEWLWVNGDAAGSQYPVKGDGQEVCPPYHCGALDRNTGHWAPVSCHEELDFLCQKL